MSAGLVRTFGNPDASERGYDEGFDIWRIFGRIAEGFKSLIGYASYTEEEAEERFSAEILDSSERVTDMYTLLRDDPQEAEERTTRANMHSQASSQRVVVEAVARNSTMNPIADTLENDDVYELVIEVPGIKAEDIDVEFNADGLKVTAVRRDAADDKKRKLVRERKFGTYERRFALPFQANPDIIQATLADGVVTLTVPRPPETKPRTRKIALKH